MKTNYILHGFIIFALIVSFVCIYDKNSKIIELELIIASQKNEIQELKEQNSIAKENCKKITKGYALVVYDIKALLNKIDRYYFDPALMSLDMSVIIARTERFMEKKNELLEEMDINVEELREEVNETIKEKGLK